MNCNECGNTGLVPVERGPAGATYTVLGRCKCQTSTITIPRAQYVALMKAAKALPLAIRLPRPWLPGGADATKDDEAWTKIDAALAALSAAGIDTGESK